MISPWKSTVSVYPVYAVSEDQRDWRAYIPTYGGLTQTFTPPVLEAGNTSNILTCTVFSDSTPQFRLMDNSNGIVPKINVTPIPGVVGAKVYKFSNIPKLLGPTILTVTNNDGAAMLVDSFKFSSE